MPKDKLGCASIFPPNRSIQVAYRWKVFVCFQNAFVYQIQLF